MNDGKKIYVWDAANRLIGVSIIGPVPTTQANNIQMSYDGSDRRVSITELHGTTVLTATTFVWCNGDMCESRDITGHTVNKRFYEKGEQINGASYYFTNDHIGSVREMTDSSGNVQSRNDYDLWGRINKLVANQTADFGFTGFYINESMGLDLTWYRAYSPEKGTWLSRDPLGESEGLNLYEYVKDSPDNYKDPKGLTIWVCSRQGKPPLGAFNHAYYWNDKNRTCCGRDSIQGGTYTGDCHEAGPPKDKCVPVTGSDGKEDKVMSCCKHHANDGVFFPPCNDCHTSVGRCLEMNKLINPGVPGGRCRL